MDALAAVLAIGGALLAFVCSVGVAVMRDPYLRLHYVGPASTLASAAVAIGFALEAGQVSPALKALMVAILLGATGGVTAHATARAVFVRARGSWPLPLDQQLPLAEDERPRRRRRRPRR